MQRPFLFYLCRIAILPRPSLAPPPGELPRRPADVAEGVARLASPSGGGGSGLPAARNRKGCHPEEAKSEPTDLAAGTRFVSPGAAIHPTRRRRDPSRMLRMTKGDRLRWMMSSVSAVGVTLVVARRLPLPASGRGVAKRRRGAARQRRRAGRPRPPVQSLPRTRGKVHRSVGHCLRAHRGG